jgi:hypothetical protein
LCRIKKKGELICGISISRYLEFQFQGMNQISISISNIRKAEGISISRYLEFQFQGIIFGISIIFGI